MTEQRKIANRIKQLTEEDKVFYSFEFYPPRQTSQLKTLYRRFDLLSQLNPVFNDVTWGAGGSTSTLTTSMCVNAQTYAGLETNMHITCTNMEVKTLKEALDKCKEVGICNIVALRGDAVKGEEWKKIEGGFAHAADLVRYVRKNYGDYFNISVAGYPEKHSDAPSYEQDLKYLKEKVDAGADVIITQLFFDADFFLKFVKDCREIGITVPIVPGIMPIVSYGGITRICGLCKSKLPQSVMDELEKVKEDEEAVKAYGIKQATDMCKKLIANGVRAIHFYTLNNEVSTIEILKGLDLFESRDNFRVVPWTRSLVEKRISEGTRPAYWQGRPKSYIARTADWKTYPSSKASWVAKEDKIAAPTEDHLASLHPLLKKTRKREWGSPEKDADIFDVFAKYWKHETPYFPWIDLPAIDPTANEKLATLCKKGFLVINHLERYAKKQAQSPGGWGAQKGEISQNEYLEFFVTGSSVEAVKKSLKGKNVKFQIVGFEGKSEGNLTEVQTLTTGKFGDQTREPIVLDPAVFEQDWRDEAFTCWNTWQSAQEEDSASAKFLETFKRSAFLVSVTSETENLCDIF